MAGLADLLEAYKNYRGVQEWKRGKEMEESDYRSNMPPGTIERAMNLWGGFDTGGLAGAIKTYHGSPRAEPFTHFSSEFMGSGEGAQAFGKGHYLAERPGIAKTYAEMRGKMYDTPKHPQYNKLLHETKLNLYAQAKKHGDPEKALKAALKYLQKKYNDAIKYGPLEYVDEVQKQIDEVNIYGLDVIKSLTSPPQGPLRSLYEVSLEWPGARESVDPMSREHFLQWDKEFRSQPFHVKEALADIADENPDVVEPYIKWLAEHNSPGHTPQSLMLHNPQSTIKALGGAIEPLLYERGVPGIAFLDQPSRTKKVGDRTYNYVAFGDEIPRIISHNKPSILKMLWPEFNK